VENYSFALVEDGHIKGICPLVFRDGQSVDGYPLPMPVVGYVTYQKACFNSIVPAINFMPKHQAVEFNAEITKRLEIANVKQYQVRSSVFSDYQRLDALAFSACDKKTSVVMDLHDMDQCWKEIRKSYRPLINQSTGGVFEVEPGFGISAMLHHATRGKVTRPIETWREMARWKRLGFARDFAWQNDEDCHGYVGSSFVIVYKNCAYNGVMSVLDGYFSGFLLWEIAKILSRDGVELFEIGWQRMAKNPKEEAIEFFRRGMGKQLKPFFVAGWEGRG